LHRRDGNPRRHGIDCTRDGSENARVKEVIQNSGDRSGRSCWKGKVCFMGRNTFVVISVYFKKLEEHTAICLY